jgi:hypothetical protein
MQLPHSKASQTYLEQIKNVEANLKEAASGEKDKALLALIQKRLDSLAEKYQYNEEIGVARYKLYELQAFVHYFNDHDDDALDFINQAIEMRGETYARAEKLKKQLSPGDAYLSKTTNPDKMTKEQRRDQKIGLEGWLAFFTVTVVISTLAYAAVAVFSIINLNNLPQTADSFASGLLSPYYSFLAFAGIVMVGVGVWLIVLLTKWKRLARWIGIAFASSAVVIAFIDYTWYADLSTQISGLGPNKASGGTFVAILWIIYLCVSRRVKRTLTK